MPEPELAASLEAFVAEVDRLLFVGEGGRQRSGVRALSAETLRYLRVGVARVGAEESPPESLRGIAVTVAEGCTADAALLALARKIEDLL
jgi:hypothetical protein